MIYTLGCSFTKWIWPTWADWLSEYSDEDVTNLGWPGLSNETIYYELLSRHITKDDTVYIMLTGSNRTCNWYDNEWIDKNDCRGFFPRADGKLECSSEAWRGLYRTHPDKETSLTHMIINNFNLIMQMQLLLNDIGCKYSMMFWQNPWYDVRPVVKPDQWQATWQDADTIIADASKIAILPAVDRILNTINWNKFIGLTDHSTDNFESYTGLWEYSIKNLMQYVDYWHVSDDHPNALIHHDFACDMFSIDPVLKEKAKQVSLAYQNCNVDYEYSSLIPDNLNARFK